MICISSTNTQSKGINKSRIFARGHTIHPFREFVYTQDKVSRPLSMASQQQPSTATPITFLPPNSFLHGDLPNDIMRKPTILFVCKTNAGSSQMAAAYVKMLGRGHVKGYSAGPAPAEFINPVVVEAMMEDGFSLSNEVPKALTTEVIRNSDVLITMNCDDACPFFNGVHRCDWRLDIPAGKSLDDVRIIRDQIRERVSRLIGEMMSSGWW